MSDIFALAVVGSRVRVEGSQNELVNGIVGVVSKVTRPQGRFESTPAYVEISHDGGRLIVSTRHLRLAGPTAVAAE